MTDHGTNTYERFFNILETMLCVADPDCRLRELNQAWQTELGFSATEMTGKPFMDYIHPDDKWRVTAQYKELLNGTNQAIFETRVLCKNGAYKWLSMRWAADREKNLVYGAAADITSRMTAEDALRESENTLRKILDKAPMSMAIVNMDGTIEYINRKAVETFGYPHTDIPTMDRWWVQAYPDEAYRKEVIPRWMGRVQEAFLKKSEIDGGEYLVTCKDGSKKTCHIFGVIAAGKVFVMFDDITRSVEAVKALRDSETALQRILDNAPTGMGIITNSGRIEYLNAKFTQTFGFTLQDIPDMESWTRLASTDEGHRKAMTKQWMTEVAKASSRAGGEIEGREYTARCKDGTLKTLAIRGVLVGDKIFIIFDDISLRVAAENAVSESARTLRQVLEQAPIGIVIHDLDGKFEFINRKLTQMFGYQHEDIPTLESWARLAYPQESYRKELLDFWGRAVEKSMRTGLEIEGGEYRVVCKDGSVKNVLISGVATADKKVVSLLEDVTARLQTQKALRESESLYRALIETTGTGYVVIDGQGKVIDANREYVRLSGHADLKEIMGRSVLDWTAPGEKEKNAKAVAQCARDGHIWNFEIDYSDKAGMLTPVEVNATVVTRGGVPQILTLCRDVTQRRQRIEEIRRLNQGLEKIVGERTAELTATNRELLAEIAQRKAAEKAGEELQAELLQSQKMELVGTLAGGIAHDFNNILVAISGYAEFLTKSLPEDAPMKADLSEILLETERGAMLTRQLTAISRKQPALPQILDLNQVIDGACKMLTRLIGTNIRLETQLSPGIGKIKADPGQVSQVIMNLVVNARDAMPDGGRIYIETTNAEITERISGKALAPAPGQYVKLTVTDTGCGMSKETLSHLFEPFFTTKEMGKGTGLGLSIISGIVSQARGGIDVASALGRGTTFTIYLPRTV